MWKKMKSAPTDGTFILVRLFKKDEVVVTVAGYDEDMFMWMKKDGTYIGSTPHGWMNINELTPPPQRGG